MRPLDRPGCNAVIGIRMNRYTNSSTMSTNFRPVNHNHRISRPLPFQLLAPLFQPLQILSLIALDLAPVNLIHRVHYLLPFHDILSARPASPVVIPASWLLASPASAAETKHPRFREMLCLSLADFGESNRDSRVCQSVVWSLLPAFGGGTSTITPCSVFRALAVASGVSADLFEPGWLTFRPIPAPLFVP